MEILKTAERYDDIGLAVEKLGLLAEKLFLGQIFLEVIVAELFVDLQLVVEALAGFLIFLPYVRSFGTSPTVRNCA